MKLFDAFAKQAPNKVFFSVVLGALSGISYAFLIPILLNAISPKDSAEIETFSSIETVMSFEVFNYKFASVFFFLCLFILITRTLSQVILTSVSLDLTANMRINLYRQIINAPIDVLESVGNSKLIATITTDVTRIVTGARQIPDVLINAVTVVGMLCFLMYLNMTVFGFVVMAMVFGVITYQLPLIVSNSYFEKSRQKVDQLHSSINGLIFGAKELKLNQLKTDTYFNDILLDNEQAVLKADKTGNTIVRAAVNYGDLVSLFVIGVVTFVFINYESISTTELLGVVMALLLTTGPVSVVISHDDRYFDVADQLIVMENGKISDLPPKFNN